MLRLILSIGFTLSFIAGSAQVSPLYPDVPASFSFNLPQINPASFPQSGKFLVSGIYKFQPAESNLAIYELQGGVVIKRTSGNGQTFRALFSNEKEGPYIHTSRGALNYAYFSQLSEKLSLSAGLSLGFINRVYSAPSSTSAGNLFLPDGNLGLQLQYQNLVIGFAALQFMNASTSPFLAVQQAKRFYHLNLQHSHHLSAFWSLKEYALIRILPEVTTQILGGANLVFNQLYELGVIYYQRRGVAFQLLLANQNEKYPLTFSLAYNSPLFAKSPLWVNSLEIGMRMEMDK